MMAKSQLIGQVLVYPAKGGLETIAMPGLQTLGRVVDGSNFIVDINSAKKKWPGAVRYNSLSPNMVAGGPFKGLFDFWRLQPSGYKGRRVTAVSGGKVWADHSDGVFVDVTGAFTIFPADNVSIETFYGLMIMAFDNNPAGGPLKYDQSAAVASLLGTPPNGKYLRTFMDRLWIGGIKAAPDLVVGSSTDDPENYHTGPMPPGDAQYIYLDQGDQDPVGVTALFPPYYGRMVVAKRRSLYQIQNNFDSSGNAYFGVTPVVSSGLGCISHNGVVGLDSDVIYPSERGIHTMSMTNKLGQIDMEYMSAPIQNLYQENVDFFRADNMRAIYIPEINHYLLSLTTKSSAGNNDMVLGYNFGTGEWDVLNENVSAFSKFVDTSDANKTKVLVGDDKGRIGIIDTTKSGRVVTWFDERVTMQFTTGIIYPLGANTTEVTFRELTVFFKPQPIANSVVNVTALVDGIQRQDLEFSQTAQSGSLIGFSTIGVAKIGGRGIVKNVSRQLHGVGKGIELIFTHKPVSDDDDCEIYGFVIEYAYSGDTDLPKSQ